MGDDAALADFRRRRATALERLCRVNEALSAWDEDEAARQMPADFRSHARRPPPDRQTLKELSAVLIGVVGEREER